MSQPRVRISIATPPHSTKQSLVMNAFFIPDLIEMWVACGTKFGKAQPVDTLIPVLNGWKRMGDIKVGDYVFDENGKPTRVEFVTDIMYNRRCYRIEFSDGQIVEADSDHLWETMTARERRNTARGYPMGPNVRTTEEILNTLYHRNKANHSIPCVKSPIEWPEKDLPIDPYVFGVWLGDGTIGTGAYTKPDDQIRLEIISRGFNVAKVPSGDYLWRIEGFTSLLKLFDLERKDRIPQEYLTASPQQRLELLQGLMDTDGTISKKGHCCFDNTNKLIADTVEALAISLGIKTNRLVRIGRLNGEDKKLCYRVTFSTDIPVFKLERKKKRLRCISSKALERKITSITEIESKPVRCIRVANQNHLYLTGSGCIPTHNTLAASTAASLFFPLKKQSLVRWVAPIYTQSKIGFNYCKRTLPPEPHVKANESSLTLTMPTNDSIFQFFHGQHPESLEGEATAATILDEAAKMNEQVYSSSKTTTTVTKGPILGISTPRGKNSWFYKKCMEAKEEMIRARFEGRRPRKIFIHAPSLINPFVSQEIIEDARKSLPSRLFRQYYEAEFVADGSVFENVGACYYTDYMEFNDQFVWTVEDAEQLEVVIGVDWARNIDYTVFTAWCPANRRLVGLWRMRKHSYPVQIGRLKVFMQKFANVLTVWHDKTGVGVALDDMLAETDIPYRGITFTNASKNQLMIKMMLGFEKTDIGIPQIGIIQSEISDLEVSTTSTGLPTYEAIEGGTDDVVMSMGLGHAAMLEHSDRNYEIMEF